MMTVTWSTIIGATGIGGLGCFVIWSLYKQWLSLPIFERISRPQTFVLMLVFLLLVFGVAIFAIYTGWGNTHLVSPDNRSAEYSVERGGRPGEEKTPRPLLESLDLYVGRNAKNVVERYPLVQGGKSVDDLVISPLSGKDNFRVSAAFGSPTSTSAVWIDTNGRATVVQSTDQKSRLLEYPAGNEFVAPETKDPTGYETIVLLKQGGAMATRQELSSALDGLLPPTNLVDGQGSSSRGPGSLTPVGGKSFLEFQNEVRDRLPKGVTLIKIVFIPRKADK